ncbi:14390_t:CDS:2 [Dentiscutata heterogama]|uniref:14390_t:CDS:1 n=1 Tax=Dentiscutata heterogama TaxID=1316150 RepID=A0ACA9JUY8_9GLOM|nr:14390_t:CDS:2 [Dentiscutata heterogama]
MGNDLDNTIQDLVDGKVRIEDFPLINVCLIEDIFYSSDNRRLYCFKEAIKRGLDVDRIPVIIRRVSDVNIEWKMEGAQRKLSQNEVQLILQENCSLKTENGYLQKENDGLRNQNEKLENQVEKLESKNEEEWQQARQEREQSRQEREQARRERQQARQERQNLQKIFFLIIFILFFFLLSCQFGARWFAKPGKKFLTSILSGKRLLRIAVSNLQDRTRENIKLTSQYSLKTMKKFALVTRVC